MENKIKLKSYTDEYGCAYCPNCKILMQKCIFGKTHICENCGAEVHICYGGY